MMNATYGSRRPTLMVVATGAAVVVVVGGHHCCYHRHWWCWCWYWLSSLLEVVRWPPSPFAMEDGSVLQWGARERCSGTPSYIAMADESVRMGDRMALQCCGSGRPSCIAMDAERWGPDEGRCNRKSCTANRSVATGAKTLQRKIGSRCSTYCWTHHVNNAMPKWRAALQWRWKDVATTSGTLQRQVGTLQGQAGTLQRYIAIFDGGHTTVNGRVLPQALQQSPVYFISICCVWWLSMCPRLQEV